MCRTKIKDGVKNDEPVVEFPTVRSETWIRLGEGIWVTQEDFSSILIHYNINLPTTQPQEDFSSILRHYNINLPTPQP